MPDAVYFPTPAAYGPPVPLGYAPPPRPRLTLHFPHMRRTLVPRRYAYGYVPGYVPGTPMATHVPVAGYLGTEQHMFVVPRAPGHWEAVPPGYRPQ